MPPRHRDESRVARLAAGDVAGTIAAPVRLDTLRFVLDGELEGVERAGPWVFSRLVAGGVRGRAPRADRRRRPDRPGRPAAFRAMGCRRPPAPAVRAAWGRSCTCPEPSPRSREGTRRQPRSRRSSRPPECARRRSTTTSSRASSRRAGGSCASVTATRSAPTPFEVARDVLLTECRAAGEISLARFRDLVGTGRRDAQLLLERFDADGLTRRDGDRRVLRRSPVHRPH